jgi:transcription-repair coupling factor (superfamily II helicase)
MVAQVGFDLFVHLLEQAVAELRGEPIVEDVDPEMTFDLEWYLPDTYVEDVGLRLSFYKRLAQAADEEIVAELGSELEDRFGPLPPPAQRLLRAMALKPALRELRVLGTEASPTRVTLHFKNDTPVDPAKLLPLVTRDRAHYKITPDMRLTKRFDDDSSDAIGRVEELLRDLRPLTRPT